MVKSVVVPAGTGNKNLPLVNIVTSTQAGAGNATAINPGTNQHKKVQVSSSIIKGLKTLCVPNYSSFDPGAVHFNGSTYLSIDSLLASDSGVCSFSYFFRTPTTPPNTTFNIWLVDADISSTLNTQYADHFSTGWADATGNFFLGANARPAGSLIDSSGHHLIGSVDCNQPAGQKKFKFYLDDVDVSELDDDSSDAFSIAFNGKNMEIGDVASGYLIADFAELWFAPGQSLLVDGDIPLATRRKYRTAGGKPVDLGADGSIPTGTSPAVFFSGNASSFATNRGTGGAFTLNGPLTTAISF